MSHEDSLFSYQLTGNDSFVIVNLAGELDSKSSPLIEALGNEILAKGNLHCVVLNFSQVSSIYVETIPAIAGLKKIIRNKPSELRICALNPSLNEKLRRAGILRSPEVHANIKEAIYSLFGRPAKAS